MRTVFVPLVLNLECTTTGNMYFHGVPKMTIRLECQSHGCFGVVRGLWGKCLKAAGSPGNTSLGHRNGIPMETPGVFAGLSSVERLLLICVFASRVLGLRAPPVVF